LYRRITGLIQKRLAELLQARIIATPMMSNDDVARHTKQQAIHCYASQLQALSSTVSDGFTDVFAPERYWHLSSMATQSHAERE
jgi:hypothetical protein